MAQRKCTVEGCERPARYRTGVGWCSMHAERWRQTGELADPRPTFEERLWSRVQKGPGCWLWTGSCIAAGYGQIEVRENGRRKSLRVHRVVWELLRGPIPEGLVLCHTCDNPPCCNPDHLFVGTHRDNILDMVSKGRNVGNALDPEERRERLSTLTAKLCSRCGEVKPPEAFGPNRGRKDGLQTYCQPCRMARRKARCDAIDVPQRS